MGKYILYVGILCAALGCGAKAAEGHLFSFDGGKDVRAEIREMHGEVQEHLVYKRLGEKKYLVRKGERIAMVDAEWCAEERIISRELVERIEQEATEKLKKRRKTGLLQKR